MNKGKGEEEVEAKGGAARRKASPRSSVTSLGSSNPPPSPRKANGRGRGGEVAENAIVEGKPAWNGAFWSKATRARGATGGAAGGPSPPGSRRSSAQGLGLSRQTMTVATQVEASNRPNERADAMLKPLLANLPAGSTVEATMYTREVETKIPMDADPKLVEKLLEGAFGQFKEGKLFPLLEETGSSSSSSNKNKNREEEDVDPVSVREFDKPDIHFPGKDNRILATPDEEAYRIEDGTETDVLLPTWQETEVQGNVMRVRQHFLAAKEIRNPTSESTHAQLQDVPRKEVVAKAEAEAGVRQEEQQLPPGSQHFQEHSKQEQIGEGGEEEAAQEEGDEEEEEEEEGQVVVSRKQQVQAYERELGGMNPVTRMEFDENLQTMEEFDPYEMLLAKQRTLRQLLEQQTTMVGRQDAVNKKLLLQLEVEEKRRNEAEGKAEQLSQQVKQLMEQVGKRRNGGDAGPSGAKKDDFDDYHWVIDNGLFSPTDMDKGMPQSQGKQQLVVKGGGGGKEEEVREMYKQLQTRYKKLQQEVETRERMKASEGVPNDKQLVSSLNARCETLLKELNEQKKMREEMEGYLKRLRDGQLLEASPTPSAAATTSGAQSVLEKLLKEEEMRRIAEETKVQVLTDQVKELLLLQTRGETEATKSVQQEIYPLQAQAMNMGAMALAQLVLLSCGFGAWLEMLLIPLFGAFPT